MYEKRLRLFAGPNGSGKSTIISSLKATQLNFGVYLNADDLEKTLRENHIIELSTYELYDVAPEEFSTFVNHHSIMDKASREGFSIGLSCENNCIINHNHQSNSYEASLIINFIIEKLLDKGKKLSFESVMSHISKLEILQKAKDKGYKNYLYFVATGDVEINISRVASRYKQGGHNVKEEKIRSRYVNSLNLLADAVQLTYRSFIWDNSGEETEFIMEMIPGKETDNTKIQVPQIPQWVQTYLIEKFS